MFCEIEARGVALDVGGQREHDFLNWLAREASFELADAQVFGCDAVYRRDFSAQDVEFAFKGAGFFDAEDVHGAFDDTDDGGIAVRVGTDGTRIRFGKSAAVGAIADAFARLRNRVGEVLRGPGVALHNVERDAFGGARPNSWQLAQGGQKLLDGSGKVQSHVEALNHPWN